MRRSIVSLLFLLVPGALAAQGRIVPRCGPPPCPGGDCAVPLPRVLPPCGARVERLASSVRVVLADRVLRYEVTEVFRNVGGVVAEADYIFPLPQGAAFEDLRLSIDGELVAGESMDARKARDIYEEIVRRQRDPALVEWMGTGLLRTRIFPIAPGEEKTVVVRYQSVATREGDALRIDYRRGTEPTGTASRGLPVRPASGATDDREGVPSSRFTLQYPRSVTSGDAYSPTHALRARDDGANRIVEARGDGAEVTVLLPLRRAGSPAITVLTHATGTEPGFALITIAPPADAPHTAPRDLTFVVDVSGSMAGRRLEQAKAAGHALLGSLTSGDRFRIVDFSTDVREFRENAWTVASEANIRAGRRYLDGLRAEGSTNISGALGVALDAPAGGAGRLPLVVFVTDGEPTVGERNPDAIAALAARRRGDARIFTVGVSTGINATLVEQLALQGRGTAHLVRDDESVEAAVSLLARRLTAPVLTDLRISAQGVRLSQLLPAGPIDVFAGQDLVVLARYEGSGAATIRLEGSAPRGPVTWRTRATFPARERANPFVARLWAAQRIGWLAAEKRRHGRSTELDDEIRALGSRFGIPTEFSSYLVLEPGMVVPRDVGGRVGTQAAGGAVRQASAAAGAAAAPPAANQQFEAVRASAQQRSAKSIASLELGVGDARERTVGNRRFTLADSTWTDSRFTTTMRLVRVKPYSTLYFELVQRIDELGQAFALGDRVVIAGRAVAIALAADGLERLDERGLQSLLRDWQP